MPWPTVIDGTASTPNDGQLLAEAGAIAQHDPEMVFGQVQFDAYKYSSDVVKISYELLEDSAFDMSSVIASLLGERLGRAQNTAATTGTGSSQPQGIVTGAVDSGITAASTTALTADEVMNLVYTLDRAYRRNGKYMMHNNTAKGLRQLKDSEGRYLLTLSNNEGELDKLFGYDLVINDDMAEAAASAKTVIFGDLAKYKMREVNSIRLRRLDEKYAENDLVGFIAFLRWDGNVLDAGRGPIKYLDQAAS